jgi:hypothetical protein
MHTVDVFERQVGIMEVKIKDAVLVVVRMRCDFFL